MAFKEVRRCLISGFRLSVLEALPFSDVARCKLIFGKRSFEKTYLYHFQWPSSTSITNYQPHNFPEVRRPRHFTKSRGRYALLLCASETSPSNIGPETSCPYIIFCIFFSVPPDKCRNRASDYSDVVSFHMQFIASF